MTQTLSPDKLVRATSLQCLDLIEAYRAEEAGGYTTFDGLGKKGLVGRYFAGEFALQLACDTSGTEAADWLALAEHKLNPSDFKGNLKDIDAYSAYAARAVLRFAQLPLHRRMVLKGQLPEPEAAKAAYNTTLSWSTQFVGLLRVNRDSRTRNCQDYMTGVAGEACVLLLGQRAAQAMGTEEWFPLLSLLLEDNANRFSEEKGKGWDISIFTHVDQSEPIERSYKVQVKTGTVNNHTETYDTDISCVNIRPDLEVSKHDSGWLAAQIIEECNFEQENPELAQARVTALLDKRTDKLLAKIDQ